NCRAPAASSDARMRSRRRATRGLAAAGPLFSGGLVLTRKSIHDYLFSNTAVFAMAKAASSVCRRRGCAGGGIPASADAQHQALQVVGLGKLEGDGVIRRLRQALEDLGVAARVDGRARDDLLEEQSVDVTRARERREDA